ncbi:MAG: prolipoprotein diacylglyceryl transferase [Bryobacteraceae bacterium]|nr:prolipoprotein diacylglyceryl transferase [Bryobacteraceae bacterium]
MTLAAPPPRLSVAGRSLCSFHVFGLAGFAAACAAAGAVTDMRGLPAWPLLALVATAVVTFLALAYATKILAGAERLVFYHHELAVLAVSAIVLWISGLPVAAYLDAVAVGLGVFLAFGRLGCGAVGCCHGRPFRHGVTYSAPHAAAGFPSPLTGVPLFPVQWVESAGAILIVAAALWWSAQGAPAGALLRLTAAGYGVLRFALEPLRGDPDRPYWRGLSEAQWTSLALLGFALTGTAWGSAALLAAAWLAAPRVSRTASPWFTPSHLHELASLLRSAAGPDVRTTSKGLSISCGSLVWEGRPCRHYSISSRTAPLSTRMVRRLIRELAALEGLDSRRWLPVQGGHGVFHILREEA